jgi:hypothetical protein
MLDSDLNIIPTTRHQTMRIRDVLLNGGKIGWGLGWHDYSLHIIQNEQLFDLKSNIRTNADRMHVRRLSARY